MVQLMIASIMVTASIIIHLLGLSALLRLLGASARNGSGRSVAQQIRAILAAAWGLFALHTTEIWAYADGVAGTQAPEQFAL